ncbi:MAG: hypothetical protein M9894_30310 [Planctomycetes bacterium]|nr:hypothetical protein [Planctomycetota bacterium]
MTLRVAAVRYANARPLWDALQGRPGVRLITDTPRGCAARLAAGECDVALAPSAEVIRRGWTALGRGGVASTDRARTVLLLAPGPLADLREVVADPTSRTSNALCEVLLRERHGVAARVVAASAAPGAGRVLIGDAALRPPPAALTLDLAADWAAWTGLPFVFCRWATARPCPPAAWANLLDDALEAGLARRPALAREEAARLGLPEDEVATYLTRTLTHALGPAHEAALARFARHLAAPARCA